MSTYIKEFDRWNMSKKTIENRDISSVSSFRERDIWWCSIGINIGSEEDGKNNLFERPVLVLKKFNNQIAWVIPLTTQLKINRYRFRLENEVILLSQLRIVNVKRFNRFIKRVSMYDFSIVKHMIIDLINYD